jgi:hypothetical protein
MRAAAMAYNPILFGMDHLDQIRDGHSARRIGKVQRLIPRRCNCTLKAAQGLGASRNPMQEQYAIGC